MSNRNFDSSTIINILKAQNTANFYNRQLQIVAGINTVPAQVEIQPANPQTEYFDAQIISTIRAGQQAYYFKNYPIITSIDPQNYTPLTVLTSPTLLSVIAGDSELIVYFTPGTGNISNYLYSLDGGITFIPFSPAQTTSPVTITGLTNGQTYNITLQAITDIGTSDQSNTISGIPSLPSPPTLLSILPDDSELIVNFIAGSGIITNYLYSIDGGSTFTAFSPAQTSSPVSITGLTNGQLYTIALESVTTVGTSGSSNTLTGTPNSQSPTPPTLLDVLPDNAQLTVYFNPGAGIVTNYLYSINNGSTYTAFSPPQTTSPVIITGLINGQTYNIVMKSVTTTGTSSASNDISGTPTFDAIASALTTSLTSYKDSFPGTWVKITAAEYSNLQTSVTSTQKAGANDALLQDVSGIGWTSSTLLAANMVTNTTPDNTSPIPANSYVYAFAVKYSGIAPNSNMAVYTNTSTSTSNPTGFKQLGSPLPPTYADSTATNYINYYVLKTPPTVNGVTPGLLGVFTGMPKVNGHTSTYYLPYAPAPLISPGVYPVYYRGYGNSPAIPPPPSSSDTLNQGVLLAVGIQALTTITAQWPLTTPATNFTVVSFTSVATTTWTAPALTTWVNYLVVGGGGGGGNGYDTGGGGGGGAGMVSIGTYSVIPGQTYTVTVGAGGAGGAAVRTNLDGAAGNQSIFDTIVALGGGAGKGSRTNGNGAGGVAQNGTISSGVGGNGGGNVGSSTGGSGGGGGGATTLGGSGTGAPNAPVSGGAGGTGLSSTISGSNVTYGTGGAGAIGSTAVTGANGTANTGNGGGGGSAPSSSAGAGGTGGSGIVIISFYQ